MNLGQSSPRYRRSGIRTAAALAALIAGVGTVVSEPGEPGGAAGASTSRSANFSLIATGEPTPDPFGPTAEKIPTGAPPAAAPAAAAPPAAAPPPQLPSELRVRYGDARPNGIPAFVSITNNAGKPGVGCSYAAVAVAGLGTAVNYNSTVHFSVNGAEETRLDRPGPATGTTWHVTVTCDNGLSTSLDHVY
jgi:hypothetical protein